MTQEPPGFKDTGVAKPIPRATHSQGTRAGVLFDRDGTLIRDEGYTHRPEELRWLPGAIDSIRAANAAGFLVIIVTNQSGLARGYYSEDDVRRFHAHMNAELRKHGAHIDAFYHCPHHGAGVVPRYTHADHPDRKPQPGMLRRALIEWSLDRKNSFLVGDSPIDIQAADAVGLRSFLVAPGELLAAVERGLQRGVTSKQNCSVSNLQAHAAEARAWLFDHALPLWWDRGFDRNSRCFHERLSTLGAPVIMPRRIRVQARQTFVFAYAGQLGWSGPWREAVEAGLDVLLERGIRADGGTCHSLDPNGRPYDKRRDLYDLAFVVLALAKTSMVLGGNRDAIKAAERLVDWLYAHWTEPTGGIYEGDIVPVPPRRQNPLMHMFEALLALYEATNNSTHLHRASQIARFIRDRCFDHDNGALPENFDAFWHPVETEGGIIVEPGHQFEWYWLLAWWRKLGGGDMREIAERMRLHGEVYGVAVRSAFVWDEVYLDGRIRSRTTRLWPHAERIKASVARYEVSPDVNAADTVAQASEMLMQFCDTPTRGVWHERRSSDGSFIEQDAPASSLYHIMFAIAELARVTER